MKRPVSCAVPRLLLLAAMPAILVACSAADNEPSPMPTGYKYTNVQQYRVPVTGPERNMQYPGMDAANEPSRLQPSAGEMATPMGAPMQSVTSTSTMTTTTQSAAMPLMKADAPAAPMPVPPPPMQWQPPAPAPLAPPPPPPPMPAPMAVSPQWANVADDLIGKSEVRFGVLHDPVYVRDASASQPGEMQFRAALLDSLARHHYKIAPSGDRAPFTFDYSLNGQPTGEETITLKTIAEGREASRVSGMYNLAATGPLAAAPMPPAAPVMMPPARPPMPASAQAAPMYQAQPQSQTESSIAPPLPSRAPASANDDAGGPGAVPPAMTQGQESDNASSGQTYVYDGRGINTPGKTAYEQIHGTDHQVDAPAGDSGAAD